MQTARGAGESDEGETIALRKDGTRFPALLSVTAMRDAAGNSGGFLCIFRDLTRQKAEEVSRQEAEERRDCGEPGLQLQ